MELSKMSHDTLAHIIESLIKKEIVKPEQIEHALIGNPSNVVKMEVDLYHNLICPHNHQEPTEEQLYCPYYCEEQSDNVWELDMHLFWTEKLIHDKKEYKIDDIKRLAKGFRDVEEALAKYPTGYQKIIKENIKYNGPIVSSSPLSSQAQTQLDFVEDHS